MGYIILAIGGLSCAVFAYAITTNNDALAITGVVAFFLTLVGGLIWALFGESKEHDRLMAQCLADGKKEYECVSLLKSGSFTIVPMPIIIPTR